MPGRTVELRRGYSSKTDALWGTVAQTLRADSLEDFFDRVPFQTVMPTARDRDEAIQMAASILGISRVGPIPLFAFEVRFR